MTSGTGAAPDGSPAALTAAVRAAARFDRSMVSPSGGLLAAIPVTAVLGGGIAAGDPVAGVTMGAGAMLVGIAWRTAGGRPPLALMATDAALMATSTFVGCVTGSVSWLHLAVVAAWALVGGLLVGVGNRGGVLGTQAVIAVVVFGRFSEPAGAALGIAGLVLAGGLAQVAFLSIVRWPLPLRTHRAATAAAYRALARLAAAPGEPSTLPAGAALDDAQAMLASPALLGDPALMTLRSLVTEGHRMRVTVAAIHSLLRRQRAAAAGGAAPGDEAARQTLATAAELLELAAGAIEGDRDDAHELLARRAALSTRAQTAARTAAADGPPAWSPAPHMARRLAALNGQLRAMATLAPAAGEGGGLRRRRPFGRTNRPLVRLRADLAQLAANASRTSPAGRHALRLAVVVVVAEILSRHLHLQRGYWMVVAAATVLRPEFGATFTRGTERALGTAAGVALAGAIVVALHPAGGVITILVGLLAWVGYSVFPASFAAGFAFITALVVFLLNAISPDTLATAEARLLDTLVGGALGLLAYALWPTWSREPAWQSLADLVAAVGAYFDGVLAAVVQGRRAHEHQLRPLSRAARLARTRAESRIAASLSEPRTRRIDADRSRGALAALRRLVQAVHVLRLDAEDDRERPSLPALAPFVSAVDELLAIVDGSLRVGADPTPVAALPDLRAAYERFERDCPRDADGAALLAELDEIVDAANGLASILGLEPVDADVVPAPA
ncbi:MAG: FUSC family protein [Solirubrobacteraceae bacterium]